MATIYTLAALAFYRWAMRRDRLDAALALGLALCCPLIKIPGLVWALTLSARRRRRAAAAARTEGRRHRVRAGTVRTAGAGANQRRHPRLPAARRFRSRMAHVSGMPTCCPAAGTCSGTARSCWRSSARGAWVRRVSRRSSVVVGTGVAFLLFVTWFTNASGWMLELTTLNRATLHLAPLVVVFGVAALAGAGRRHAACRRGRAGDGLSSRAHLRSPHARSARSHALLHRYRQPRAGRACAAPVGGRASRFARSLFLTDRQRRRTGHRSPHDRAARLARRLFALRAGVAARSCRYVARPAGAMGWLRAEPGGVARRLPRLRLHRRQVVLGAGRPARRQRRLFAALAPAARSPARSAHRADRGRGRDHLPDVPGAARARARDPLRDREAWPTSSHSRPRTRSACRSDFTACTTSAASFPKTS